MPHFQNHTEPVRTHDRNADYGAVNNSPLFIFLVAVVAIMISVPLALFF